MISSKFLQNIQPKGIFNTFGKTLNNIAMEQERKHQIHSISITPVPKINITSNTTTPNELIKQGIYNELELLNYIEDKLCEGLTYRQLAIELNVKLTSFVDWCAKPERFARIKLALLISADYYFEQSLEVLKNCAKDKESIMLAHHLSSRYAWAASKRNVNLYGDKVDVTSDNKPIVQVNLGSGIAPPELLDNTKYIDITSE